MINCVLCWRRVCRRVVDVSFVCLVWADCGQDVITLEDSTVEYLFFLTKGSVEMYFVRTSSLIPRDRCMGGCFTCSPRLCMMLCAWIVCHSVRVESLIENLSETRVLVCAFSAF